MRQRHIEFVVVFLMIFNGEIFSQIKMQEISIPANNNPSKTHLVVKNYSGITEQENYFNFFHRRMMIVPEPPTFKPSIFVLPATFYSSCLPFFCKEEIKIEKVTSIPFRFRLGSLDYVNYLEQKPGSIKP